MPISHLNLAKYRYYRLALAMLIGLFTLLLTLALHIYEQSRIIHNEQLKIARHTVTQFENFVQPSTNIQFNPAQQVSLSCSDIQPSMQLNVALLQTLRAIVIVKNGHIVCSSLLGPLDLDFASRLPDIANGKAHLLLAPSWLPSISVPTLLLWRPSSPDNQNGLLFIYNIEVLSSFLLEPQYPYAPRITFNTLNYHLEYNHHDIVANPASSVPPQLTINSDKYDFAIALYGKSPSTLAWMTLPQHLPLSILISLLIAIAVYLLSGTRISMIYPITHAISHQEFQVYCQPIINSINNSCVGVETLLRWKNRRNEWVSPDVFIPLAEQHGLIIPLTRYLLSTIAGNLALFPNRSDFYISINVAAQHFEKMLILEDIQKLWVPAQSNLRLMLELTERTPFLQSSTEYLHQLKALGILLAIDDFGTGHSSLSYLKTLKPDVLKIDYAFTASIGTDAINATVTDTIITLAQRLNLKLIAEGVETSQQVDYLRTRHVDSLQGYYFARPMPIEVFANWLKRYEKENGLTPAPETSSL
jgi:sensor c-di-GMP phosphodiesterase-like protein